MQYSQLVDHMENSPVIGAVRRHQWDSALESPVEILFCLDANLLTIKDKAAQAHAAGKCIFVHMDLTDGIARDRTAVQFLAECGVDGILSTKPRLIRWAKECGLLTVQRFFVLDSQGMNNIQDMLATSAPHVIEIMPGVVTKVIKKFRRSGIPVIAGGLLETKAEVTAALAGGAAAVSTSREDLWYL